MPWISLGQGDEEIWIEEEKDPDTIIETEEDKEKETEKENA